MKLDKEQAWKELVYAGYSGWMHGSLDFKDPVGFHAAVQFVEEKLEKHPRVAELLNTLESIAQEPWALDPKITSSKLAWEALQKFKGELMKENFSKNDRLFVSGLEIIPTGEFDFNIGRDKTVITLVVERASAHTLESIIKHCSDELKRRIDLEESTKNMMSSGDQNG